ncbi:ExeM/NucH family extracellular endonuclease [Alteromonas lipolytica]|uniref:LTD domain-containing protein n=1 Tax=Alteromonas lipolytica TaxID=1856405 RepID=A0A1E8FB89_9ALTE|nr:ExeM/NucH family extracellular endonuclease [Alteromonas lipolytica]OFI32763.1 hypothetical protein BFC17_06325 [Alteromonas lipolytica]GGF73282.1 hypothetical protein GCM10011338_26790 [Alteromonas lipolytica]
MKAKLLLPLVFSLPVSALADDLFISEYIEGSSFNKAIEIFNPTDTAIDLAGYRLEIYSNGRDTVSSTINLSGTIASGGVYVVADDNANESILAVTNLMTTSSLYNGDDAIVLVNNSTVIDSFGQVGTDPGSAWQSNGISTANKTLVRKSTIATGDIIVNDAFDVSLEWIQFDQDYTDDLGMHTYDAGSATPPGDDDEDLEDVCTNCPDIDKVADAASFDPVAYYAPVQTEIDANAPVAFIKQALNQVISADHTVLDYREVWTALTETDEDPGNPDNVILFYSGISLPKTSNQSGVNNNDFWNREHVWPNSHGFGSQSYEAYTDIHHLRPEDVTVNGSRGNLDFDYSDNPLAEAPANRIDNDSFEPRDTVKGDVARMMLYMDVRYEGSGSDNTPDLVLVDRTTSAGDAELGKLCTLLAWHNGDPVDASEEQRAATIYEYQGNRNPFVDHPEWVDLLYPAASCGDEPGEPEEPPIDPEEPPVPVSTPLILAGVIDGDLSGGLPKAVEVFVTADMPDMSVCGIGFAQNGGGTDGQEFTFPAMAASAGESFIISNETSGFTAFFGEAPDFQSGQASINGDDAIELFCNGELVDVFGDPEVNGDYEAWDYTDSWAYRVSNTTASTTFNPADWTMAGRAALDGESTNATAATPYPYKTFTAVQPELFFSEYTEGSSLNKALEIVNLGSQTVDLSAHAYVITVYSNGSSSPGFSVTLSGTIAAGDVFVVAEPGAAQPLLDVADQLAGINFNGDDAVVFTKDGEVIDAIGQVGFDPGTQWGTGDTSTRDNTLRRLMSVQAGDTNPDDVFDPAVEWAGFPNNTFDNFGIYGDGNTGPEEPPIDEFGACFDSATLISAVQGSGSASPLSGQTVIIEGVVTSVVPDIEGFFMQEEDSDHDSDPLTSEGIFVDTLAPPAGLQNGDVVRVMGTAGEEFGRTRLTAVTESAICGTATVTPTEFSLPQENADDFEALENMLVVSNASLTISDTYRFVRYGEILVSNGRLYNPTQLFDAGSQDAIDYAEFNARNQLIIDDNRDGSNNSAPMLSIGEVTPFNPLRSGDTVTYVEGIMDYGYSAYRIRPVANSTVVNTNPREEAPVIADGNLSIASFNVLNLFNGNGDSTGFPTSRGANNYAEYQRQLSKIVKAIVAINADIVGLMEIENDGFASSSAIAQLVAAINTEMGPGTYDFINAGSPIGTDEITVGIIYKPGVVTPEGAPQLLSSANSIVDIEGPLFDDGRNRPSLAQAFVHSETRQTVVVDVNHLKSKGSTCGAGDDSTNGQGNCNLTRTRAAQALVAWLSDTFAGLPVAVLGDMNSYGMEDPIQVFADAGLADAAHTILGDTAYSYTFDGLVGSLDYQLVNPAMSEWLIDATEWHINADELSLFDYNEEYKDADMLNELLFRASDHDPVIAAYQLEMAPVLGDMDGDFDVDRLDIRAFQMAIVRRQPLGMEYDFNNDGNVNMRDLPAMRALCTRQACRP